jgi:hypothetical protein
VKRRSGGRSFGAVGGHAAVQPDDGVQIHEAAALILADLHVGHAHPLAQILLRHPMQRGELPWQVDRGASPQLAEQVVPDHRARVVKAVGAQRLAEARVVGRVDLPAAQGDAVRTDRRVTPRPTPHRLAIRAEQLCVHDAEGWGSQRREQGRVSDDGLGDALAAA